MRRAVGPLAGGPPRADDATEERKGVRQRKCAAGLLADEVLRAVDATDGRRLCEKHVALAVSGPTARWQARRTGHAARWLAGCAERLARRQQACRDLSRRAVVQAFPLAKLVVLGVSLRDVPLESWRRLGCFRASSLGIAKLVASG